MAFDEELADRIRRVLDGDLAIDERRMFGGLAFLHLGNMAVGIVGDELMVRVGPDAWTAALAQPGVREMDFTGRSMTGFVFVSSDAIADDQQLAHWVDAGLAFAQSLPPKDRSAARKR